jgi:hypothetical protein
MMNLRVSTVAAAALLIGCSPSAPEARAPKLPVPIRGAERMTLLRGAALERLVRGSVQPRAAVGGGAAPVERFAAQGDAYTLAYERPDSAGRYRVTPDRVCLVFTGDRSTYCRYYLTDAAGKVWMAEDDRDYPLHAAEVTIARGK